jgi:hypothetical protein
MTVNKRLLAAAALCLTIAQPMYAGFAEVARAIDAKQGVSRVWIPFLGIARFAVRMIEPEGVRDFQLVTFEGADRLDARELQQIMRTKIGAGFMPLVQVRSKRSAEWSFIYARPHHDGKSFEVVVLAHDDSDTVLVRVEVDSDVLARELNKDARGVIRIARR